jgi:hypothetical protein
MYVFAVYKSLIEGDVKFLGYMNRKFKYKQEAYDYYNLNNTDTRKMGSYSKGQSDINPISKLFYKLETYKKSMLLDIFPFPKDISYKNTPPKLEKVTEDVTDEIMYQNNDMKKFIFKNITEGIEMVLSKMFIINKNVIKTHNTTNQNFIDSFIELLKRYNYLENEVENIAKNVKELNDKMDDLDEKLDKILNLLITK